jgi:hypothetical protein
MKLRVEVRKVEIIVEPYEVPRPDSGGAITFASQELLRFCRTAEIQIRHDVQGVIHLSFVDAEHQVIQAARWPDLMAAPPGDAEELAPHRQPRKGTSNE